MLLFIHVEVFKTKRRVVETDKWKRRRGKNCIERRSSLVQDSSGIDDAPIGFGPLRYIFF